MGNPARGDDGFGPALIAALPALPGVVAFDAGMAPENWLGPIARAEPRTVLFVDAADIGEAPGTLRLLRAEELGGCGLSTHALPLGLLLPIAEERCGAPCLLLAVQPLSLAHGERLSMPVQAALQAAAKAIAAAAASPRRQPRTVWTPIRDL